MKRVAPKFFSAAGVSAASGLLGGLGSAFGGGQKIVDDTAVRQQLQAKQIAAQRQAQTASLTQRAGEQQLAAGDRAARQRVEALDRIIGTFQQNLRIK